MKDQNFSDTVNKRRTFAIISHPDAGKTTITEKLLLLGGAIQLAGTVKGRKSGRMATSDWMKMEQDRGISITTSVMQFHYNECIVNLLDTPGHEDFSEDTYRTLTAVDSVLMVVDGAKGVEDRTIKLMEVCRLRDTPIFTFINKMDREVRDPIEVLDEIEQILKIKCAPITWPIGCGNHFKGVYNLYTDTVYLIDETHSSDRKAENNSNFKIIKGINAPELVEKLGIELHQTLCLEIELVQGASHSFNIDAYLQGKLSPIFFGTALGNFGVKQMLDDFVKWAPAPQPRETTKKTILANDTKFSGFVFKIQANMDPKHRDRIAFFRICSGKYNKNMKMYHVRTGKSVKISDAVTFLAGSRTQVEEAISGDIIGLHNHGTIRIGDTFTVGETLKFKGIPHFAPELFRAVRLKDPLKLKQLKKGLQQLSEEGATQLFIQEHNNTLILGAVGVLQFEVVKHRLQNEYKVDCIYESTAINTARWIFCNDATILGDFKRKCSNYLALDGGGCLTYLATSRANLMLTEERWPKVQFSATREYG